MDLIVWAEEMKMWTNMLSWLTSADRVSISWPTHPPTLIRWWSNSFLGFHQIPEERYFKEFGLKDYQIQMFARHLIWKNLQCKRNTQTSKWCWCWKVMMLAMKWYDMVMTMTAMMTMTVTLSKTNIFWARQWVVGVVADWPGAVVGGRHREDKGAFKLKAISSFFNWGVIIIILKAIILSGRKYNFFRDSNPSQGPRTSLHPSTFFLQISNPDDQEILLDHFAL